MRVFERLARFVIELLRQLISEEHPFLNLFKEEESICKSDVDEQLLMTVAYKDPVAVKSIKFVAPEDGSAPKKVRLFVNYQTLGFTYDCSKRES